VITIKGTCRIVLLSVAAIVFVASFLDRPVFGDLKKDTSELMSQGRYKEAQKAFESDLNATWRDPDNAGFYGQTLSELGRKSEAIKVWERVVRQFPGSEAAKLARYSILAQTGKSALASDGDIGIVGMKFKVTYGRPAEVETVFPGTPAEKSHLQAGDLIMTVDGEPTSMYTAPEITELISGRPETRVTLTIKRGEATIKKVLTRMHSSAFASAHPEFWKIYVAPK
jgi:C-terminal processing protease CtpA/Prc